MTVYELEEVGICRDDRGVSLASREQICRDRDHQRRKQAMSRQVQRTGVDDEAARNRDHDDDHERAHANAHPEPRKRCAARTQEVS
jgi:hypothetical protein